MTEGPATIDNGGPEVDVALDIERGTMAAPAAAAKPRGRPRGTDYRGVDAPEHEKMRRLLLERKVPSLAAAARSVADGAYGDNTKLESKIRRLVRTYPFGR